MYVKLLIHKLSLIDCRISYVNAWALTEKGVQWWQKRDENRKKRFLCGPQRGLLCRMEEETRRD